MESETLHCVKWEPLQVTSGHIYVFPSVRVVRVAWRRCNAVVRQIAQIESDCVTCERAAREFIFAFHDGVFERGEMCERDYESQLEMARGYIYEYLEMTAPVPSVGYCDAPIWGDCY